MQGQVKPVSAVFIMNKNKKILLYGYGNPGRQDDGLGNQFVEKFRQIAAQKNLQNIHFDSNYQLNIEDAEVLTNYDYVIFADATIDGDIEKFLLTKVDGKREVSFTSHSASPSYLYMLANDLFGNAPETYLMHIRGYEFEFLEGLTQEAQANLDASVKFIEEILHAPELLAKNAVIYEASTLS